MQKMNKLVFVLLFLVSCSSIASRPDKLGVEKLNFELPKVETWKMSNGIEVYFYRNDELPLVQGKMYFKGGSVVGDMGVVGLAEATGSQIRSGGVIGIKPNDLDRELDALAASIESDFDQEFGDVSFFSLKEDFNRVFQLYSKVIRTPSFAPEKLEIWKSLAQEKIHSRKDNANLMAGMTFAQLLFGQNSPYSSYLSVDSLKKITPDALKKFHAKFVNPNNAFLSISGSISKEELVKALEQNFADWQKPKNEIPEMPKVKHQLKPGIYVLEKDFDQATVMIGHRGPARHTEDQYAIKIFNQAFGDSGFSSVLTKKIRTDLGLAYYVHGGLASAAVEGIFQVQLATRVDQATRSVEAAIDLIKQVRQQAPEEFESAKSSTARSFVFKFDDQDFIPERQVLLKLYGYSADYDAQYLNKIDQVTKEQIREVAVNRLNPDELCVVIVGRVSAEAVKKEFAGKYNVYRLDFDTEPKFIE